MLKSSKSTEKVPNAKSFVPTNENKKCLVFKLGNVLLSIVIVWKFL
jgi:hypothetical protein